MTMWHRHQWDELERIVAPPANGLKLGACEMPVYLAQQFTFGVTTIIQKCRACGLLKTVEVLGSKLP